MTRNITAMLLLISILVMADPGVVISEEGLERDFQAVSRMYHNSVKSGCLYFEFNYQTVNPISGSSELIPGNIWLHADQFRMEADGNLFIRDERDFYQVFNLERQIFVDSNAATDDDLHPVGLLSQLESHFAPKSRTLLSDGSEQYELEPLGSDWLLEAGLKIQNGRITELRLVDINSTNTVIQIAAELRTDRVADSLFQLPSWTSDYETIDLRGASR